MKKALLITALFTPSVALAQEPTFAKLVQDFIDIFDALIPVLFVLAFVVFFWGVAKFIAASGRGDEAGVRDGKKVLGWGIIALTVMVFLFSAAVFLRSEFGFDQTNPPGSQGVIPLLPTQ